MWQAFKHWLLVELGFSALWIGLVFIICLIAIVATFISGRRRR